MAYQISWSEDYVVVSLTDEVDGDQILALVESLASDPRFDDLRKRIYDCRQIEAIAFTANELKAYAHIDNAAYLSNPNAHVAFIAPDPQVKQKLELYGRELMHKNWKLAVFNSLEDSLGWQPNAKHCETA